MLEKKKYEENQVKDEDKKKGEENEVYKKRKIRRKGMWKHQAMNVIVKII